MILLTGTFFVINGLTVMINNNYFIAKIFVLTYIIVYLSPFYKIYNVFQEKNYDTFPIIMSWLSLVTSIFWMWYGVLNYDMVVVVPHLIGYGSAVVQIVIYLKYIFIYKNFAKKYFSRNGIKNKITDERVKEEITIKINNIIHNGDSSDNKINGHKNKFILKNEANKKEIPSQITYLY